MQTERHVKQQKNCCALLFIQIRYFPIFFHSVSAFFIEQSQLLTHKAIFVNNADVLAWKKAPHTRMVLAALSTQEQSTFTFSNTTR